MDASPSHDTTVAVPNVSAPALAELVGELQAAYPADARVARGVAVLFGSALRTTPELGTYQVQACDGSRWYTTRAFSCDCPDATQRPTLVCKHQIAVQLLHSMSAAARREQLEERWWPTAKAAAV